jgi:uridine kinase
VSITAVPNPAAGAAAVIAALSRVPERAERRVVAIDGGSGAGKTLLAAELRRLVDSVVVTTDDFCVVDVPYEEWRGVAPSERAHRIIDWGRLRREAIEPLLAGHTIDYETYDYPISVIDGSVATHSVRLKAAPVIVLDGIYSSRPELSDLIGLSVLVDVEPDERLVRHNSREDGEDLDWHEIWDPAEDYYFSEVRPPDSFDLVLVIASA